MLGLKETDRFNTFDVYVNDKEFHGKYGHNRCFQIAYDDPEEVLGKDDIITHAKKATVIFRYPLTEEFKFEFKNSQGKITRREFVLFIQSTYRYIYNKEAENKKSKRVMGIYNRQSSNGPYGIWGHHIDDLVIEGVRHIGNNVYTLIIGS